MKKKLSVISVKESFGGSIPIIPPPHNDAAAGKEKKYFPSKPIIPTDIPLRVRRTLVQV